MKPIFALIKFGSLFLSLTLFINTHHTKDEAEADIGEIYFSPG
jgi:hypothetical protein